MGLPFKRPTQYVVRHYLTPSSLFSQIALKNDIDYATVLEQLREARTKGLTIPVLLMGISEASMIP